MHVCLSHKTKVQQELNATPHVEPQEASSGTAGPGTDTVKITENETCKCPNTKHTSTWPQTQSKKQLNFISEM